MRRQLVQRNVATLVTIPRVRRPEPIAVKPDRLHLFARLAFDHELARLWYLAMVYGWRRAELVGVGWTTLMTASDRATRIGRLWMSRGSPLRPLR
jgi:hypothetical protein